MSGRIFLFGDDIDTDQLAPGQYMKGGLAELAAHCLEAVRPDFPASVGPGDIVVAGRNFGMGSSREQAAEALKFLGVAAVVARSFAGIFYRNAINLGLPVIVAEGDLGAVRDGVEAVLDLDAGQLQPAGAAPIVLEPLPDNLKALLADGGLVPHLKKRFAAERGQDW
ncbi:LeuD/DmdB family oxidoreductase small subunit [Mesorhizobium koreense]|jgi:3-isopropylmalate/(R)-2-methylmalate dehydratase small subunit|uniref:LeuD/DmdB family oxidoreductase small subunit n=1 Tax=Mesorhizobium koreense TaxID=3074855 RepID=UPI00287B99F1|nr:3-isopropylmalate dehydratase [Mesorhizobium sp. WR6]